MTVNSVLAGPDPSEGVGQLRRGRWPRSRASPAEQAERDFFSTARPTSLLQRFATPEEVAAFTVFVAGGPASAVNGASLRVDGGVVRAIV